ncbi:AzlD domain-containing protein [Streptomyces cyaneus]|uniref:AzlD domain-containing protein n=1 Tax=Streptomyces cyaneus TaxID=1904 RepID=UPI002482FA6E|nr:AzlD domain-containing protein [Streptomyces cyaneus]
MCARAAPGRPRSRRGHAHPTSRLARKPGLPDPRALPFPAPAPLAGVAVTTGLHLWRRNALLSVLVGTAVHGGPGRPIPVFAR